MNDLASAKLCEIVARYGQGVCDEPRKLRALLIDLCPGMPREVNTLVTAVEQRVVADLLGSAATLPWEMLAGRLVRRLVQDTAMTEEAARWVIVSWARALGRTDATLPAGPVALATAAALPEDTRQTVHTFDEPLPAVKPYVPPGPRPHGGARTTGPFAALRDAVAGLFAWVFSLVWKCIRKIGVFLGRVVEELLEHVVGLVVLYVVLTYFFRPGWPLSGTWILAKFNVGFAEEMLGDCYRKGDGGASQDLATAAEWYRRAAEHGSDNAPGKLGQLYEENQGVPSGLSEKERYEQAVSWYQKGADRGDGEAQARLAYLYEINKGVPAKLTEEARYKEAASWYRKAADKGHAGARTHLGSLYERGKGVARDPTEAARLYRQASEDGNTFAMKRLADLLEKGDGVPRDPKEAARLRKLAAAKKGPSLPVAILKLDGITIHVVSAAQVRDERWFWIEGESEALGLEDMKKRLKELGALGPPRSPVNLVFYLDSPQKTHPSVGALLDWASESQLRTKIVHHMTNYHQP